MAQKLRRYDKDYKIQAVKLAGEIGVAKAARELGIPTGTLHGWMHKARKGKIALGPGNYTPESAIGLAEELILLRKKLREQDKEIKRLRETNEFLEEASAFFAASRLKSSKKKE